MKGVLVLLAILVSGLLEAQTPTTQTFNVIGKTYVEANVGVGTQCRFWSLTGIWRVEIACYENGSIVSLYVMVPGKMLNDTYHSNDGSISWSITSTITSAGITQSVSYTIVIGLPGLTNEKLRIDSF